MRIPVALRRLAVLALAAVPIACFSSIGSQARFKATRNVPVARVASAAIPVRVETRNGSIVLRQGPTPVITANLRATSQARLDTTQVLATLDPTGALWVRVAWPGGKPEMNEGCSFDVTLPGTTAVNLESSNGRLELASLSGPAELRTSNGAITVNHHHGDVRAETSNGKVALRDIDGSARADTSNGAVEVKDVAGLTLVRTSNGSVDLALAAPQPFDIQTSNGSVDLTLPQTFAGRLSFQTSNGSVNYPKSPGVTPLQSSRTSAEINVNQGGPPSSARTSNGSVQLHLR